MCQVTVCHILCCWCCCCLMLMLMPMLLICVVCVCLCVIGMVWLVLLLDCPCGVELLVTSGQYLYINGTSTRDVFDLRAKAYGTGRSKKVELKLRNFNTTTSSALV